MVINEKGLLRAMKEAYKSEGYEIKCKDNSGVQEIEIETTKWRVTCVLKNMPRKVLGMIVEHMGEIPKPGQAMLVKKGEQQMKLFADDLDTFCDLLPDDSANPAFANKTHIVYRYGNIWQHSRGNKVFWVNPELEEIMLLYSRVFSLGDKVLGISGSVSGVYIKTSDPQNAQDKRMLDYLAGTQLYE